MAKLGLRSKSLLALVLACVLALIPAVLVGWYVVDGVREHFGLAYAENFTQLNRQKIIAPISRELALSRRLANSEVTRQWLLDPNNTAKRNLFFKEAEGYRYDFSDHAYFIASRATGEYFFNDDQKPVSDAPRYVLSPTDPADAWFYDTLRGSDRENINVNPDEKLKVTRVWLNVVVRDGARAIGLTGAGLDLSGFLRSFVGSGDAGVTPMIIDASGAIQAHPNQQLIAYNSGAGGASSDRQIFGMLPQADDRAALRRAMVAAAASPDVQTLRVGMDGKQQLLSLAYLPELRWYVVTGVDLGVAHVFETRWLTIAVLALCVLMAIMLLVFGYAVERLVLRPLSALQQSARAIADGRYDVSLPPERNDEIGDLSRAFGVMAERVRRHTGELEGKVRERTSELARANTEMAQAHKKIDDSIDYASLIQRAILPDRQLLQSLGAHHFVMWRPRDIVGGDFYLFLNDGENFLLGIMDCAGHGVPGALMTMLARAAIDLAVAEVGRRDPAAILQRTDAAMRAMLADAQLPRALATNMDAGLAYVDRAARTITYAGAKVSLYASNGHDVIEYEGAKRALGDKRMGLYENTLLPMPRESTFYMVTDGFLDQAGGEHGFGFGSSRFCSMLKQHALLGLQAQAAAFVQVLGEYQGDRPQRDDITMLSFRFD
jgi:serine phosphatase RsbU (regulator of sigma subunit)